MFFDDATIYGGHLCPHTYKCQWKQKWKVLKIQVVAISEFQNMNGIYVQRFALYFQFKWTEKEKNEESKKNTCGEKQFTILMFCAWFWCFLVNKY